jgi:hypothetical protein
MNKCAETKYLLSDDFNKTFEHNYQLALRRYCQYLSLALGIDKNKEVDNFIKQKIPPSDIPNFIRDLKKEKSYSDIVKILNTTYIQTTKIALIQSITEEIKDIIGELAKIKQLKLEAAILILDNLPEGVDVKDIQLLQKIITENVLENGEFPEIQQL